MSKWPVFEPILELLHTQRFVLLICAVVGYLVSIWLPNLLPWLTPENAQSLGTAIAIGLGLAATGLHLEVLVETWKTLPTDWKEAIQEILIDIVNAALPKSTTTMTSYIATPAVGSPSQNEFAINAAPSAQLGTVSTITTTTIPLSESGASNATTADESLVNESNQP